jgi:choloylglycine hydrolase
LPQHGEACSTFYIDHGAQSVFGKNYDWSVDVGFLTVNKRGVSKVALVDGAPTKWISKYGSVTFNQYGREFPSGGMNEAGLVVELMWLEETEYPRPDSRPAVGKLQWIQYQLDNSASVEDIIASDTNVRIEPGGVARIHYLVADRTGNCATIEFINGKLVYHTDDALPWRVLTNDTYASSVDYLKRHQGFGGEAPVAASASSLDRFANAANMVARFEGDDDARPVDYAFEILETVAQGDYTKWSIVYDLDGATIHFRTLANRDARFVRLNSLDFDCATPVEVLDVDAPLSGDVTDKFVRYTYDRNRRVIKKAFAGTSFLRKISPRTLDYLSRYPADMRCVTEHGL